MSDSTVWFITGAARGMGADIARAALHAGHRVVATARDTVDVTKTLGAREDLRGRARMGLVAARTQECGCGDVAELVCRYDDLVLGAHAASGPSRPGLRRASAPMVSQNCSG